MRILHLDPDDIDNPMSGGGPVRTFEVYRRLAARHDITVLTPTFPGSTPELVRDGVRYVRLGRRIGNHGSSHHLTFLAALPREVRRRRYDLLVEDFMPPASATINPLFARGPVLASVQWYFAQLLSKQFHLPFHRAESLLLRLYRHFLVQTPAMAEELRRRRPDATITCIPPGTDTALFSQPATSGRDFILYLGRIDVDQKGVDLLLAAWARVVREHSCTLVLAGHMLHEVPIRTLVGELGIGESVRFAGKVIGAERIRLFRDCRFVVVPSREETFGMVIAEACAAAKPVVLFDRPPMSEVACPDGCVRVPAFDVDALARAIAMLLGESDERLVARGLKCRAFAQRYDWDTVALAQEALYEETRIAWAETRRRP